MIRILTTDILLADIVVQLNGNLELSQLINTRTMARTNPPKRELSPAFIAF